MKHTAIFLLSTLLSASALANSNTSFESEPNDVTPHYDFNDKSPYRYAKVGLQFGKQKADSMSSFLGDTYEGKGSRNMFGLSGGASFSANDSMHLIKLESDLVTSGNTDYRNTYFAYGVHFGDMTTSVALTGGLNIIDYQREKSSNNQIVRFDEHGFAADISVRHAFADWFALIPRYRVSTLDGDRMHDVQITSEFRFNNSLGMEVNFGFNDYRNAEYVHNEVLMKVYW